MFRLQRLDRHTDVEDVFPLRMLLVIVVVELVDPPYLVLSDTVNIIGGKNEVFSDLVNRLTFLAIRFANFVIFKIPRRTPLACAHTKGFSDFLSFHFTRNKQRLLKPADVEN